MDDRIFEDLSRPAPFKELEGETQADAPMNPRAPAPSASKFVAPQATGKVVRLPLPETDGALVAALRAGRSDAREALFDRYSNDVERVLYRILGPDPDIMDLLQDVFVAALTSLDKLRNADALRSWLTGIAVRKARKLIVRRRRWRFISLEPAGGLPEREAHTATAEVSEALRSTYGLLAKLPADERIAFALRHIDGMELSAVATACGVSLATIKRRLSRAQQTFVAQARQLDSLREWLDRGDLA
jgi:RNA polymerase sigma-70 factor (ECF subfamily)